MITITAANITAIRHLSRNSRPDDGLTSFESYISSELSANLSLRAVVSSVCLSTVSPSSEVKEIVICFPPESRLSPVLTNTDEPTISFTVEATSFVLISH